MVGAGTGNPATVLRVLGPEPWAVGYVEPSFRPDDGRFGDNPNRVQMHHQYQVILKPSPENVQDLYLGSLEAIGLKLTDHDVRFVEDNWESPALGAWGLGWEVWLDGMEITQYTYFQQSAGQKLDPPACELTYGLERIAMYLQEANTIWDISWNEKLTYGQLLKTQEIEFCEYDFNSADVKRMEELIEIFRAEAESCLSKGLVIPAHDLVLRCSHTFNILDARGVVGLSERVKYFGVMRDLSRKVAEAFLKQREEQGFPLRPKDVPVIEEAKVVPTTSAKKETFAFEIGFEELASGEVPVLIEQISSSLPGLLEKERLSFGEISVGGTPRRLSVTVESVQPKQDAVKKEIWGPPRDVCSKNPAALAGFCRKFGLDASQVEFRVDARGGECACAVVDVPGLSAGEVLAGVCVELLSGLKCGSSMRWLDSAIYGAQAKSSLNRPLRWLMALFGKEAVPFSFAGVVSGRTIRAGRWEKSVTLEISDAAEYRGILSEHGVEIDPEKRRAAIEEGIRKIAAINGDQLTINEKILDEVTQLVECPVAFECSFDERFLPLPDPVRVAVLEKHIRCFALKDTEGNPRPRFVGVANGMPGNPGLVRQGYERVATARFSDAEFFYNRDKRRPFEEFRETIKRLLFHAKIGSMYDKSVRLVSLVGRLLEKWPHSVDRESVLRAAALSKNDLGTQMVTEMTSLAGRMGAIYALESGEEKEVADAIEEQYLPAAPGGKHAEGAEGLLLGVADRLDTLAALFSIGVEPTGSADPYALRREGLNLLSSLIGRGIDVSMTEAFVQALAPFPDAPADTVSRLLDFIEKRLEVMLREQGYRHDVVAAVLERAVDRPARAVETVKQLGDILSDSVNAQKTRLAVQAYLRSARIIAHAAKQGIKPAASIEAALFQESEEKSLQAEYSGVMQAGKADEDFPAAFAKVRKLTPAITRYFDKVLVMAEDEKLRANRLALVSAIVNILAPFADLMKLEGFAD